MGLIKSAINAVSSTLSDQWEEYIKCDSLDNDTLMVRKSTKNGIITKKSAIQVSPGQIAVIFDSGKILDATAEEGVYSFDESSSPSFFAGDFGDVFKEMWNRFKYNGGVSKEQAIFFINKKEIIDNKFGTPAPVPYQDYSHPILNQMTNSIMPVRLNVKCFGKYTFKISNPAVFMREIAGVTEVYTKKDICEQMRSEVQSTFQTVLNELGNSEHQTPVLELPSKANMIKEIMNQKVFDEKIRERGLSIVGFVVESVTLDDESNKKIDNYELGNSSLMQQGTVVGSYADAVVDAANNSNGATNGFMGVGMTNMVSGGIFGNTVNNPSTNGDRTVTNQVSNEADFQVSNSKAKFCPNCGTKSHGGNFCSECGTKL